MEVERDRHTSVVVSMHVYTCICLEYSISIYIFYIYIIKFPTMTIFMQHRKPTKQLNTGTYLYTYSIFCLRISM